MLFSLVTGVKWKCKKLFTFLGLNWRSPWNACSYATNYLLFMQPIQSGSLCVCVCVFVFVYVLHSVIESCIVYTIVVGKSQPCLPVSGAHCQGLSHDLRHDNPLIYFITLSAAVQGRFNAYICIYMHGWPYLNWCDCTWLITQFALSSAVSCSTVNRPSKSRLITCFAGECIEF